MDMDSLAIARCQSIYFYCYDYDEERVVWAADHHPVNDVLGSV